MAGSKRQSKKQRGKSIMQKKNKSVRRLRRLKRLKEEEGQEAYREKQKTGDRRQDRQADRKEGQSNQLIGNSS
jgi:hypothetical protein